MADGSPKEMQPWAMDGHGWPWMAMDGHGWPWMAMDGHGNLSDVSVQNSKHVCAQNVSR